MLVPELWLRAYANPSISTQALSDQLTMAGLEVEELGKAGPEFSGVVVGKILGAEKHPDADRLRVCQVEVGDGSPRNIVCGAPNAAAGMTVACALPGAVLPGGLQIKDGKIRGVASQGMLCSAKELGLAEESSGLIALDDKLAAGLNVRDALALDEAVFTLKLTPNRADCLSMLGVAREVAALNQVPLSLPTHAAPAVSSRARLPVKVVDSDLCGRFSGRIIENVNCQAATPDWMKTRLERAGQRSISALVDISNYVLLERGRPTHIFDADKVDGGLMVRWGKPGETLKLLNGQTVELDANVGVIADSKDKPESLAGIMGGDHTAVGDDTKNVFVEAAFWWPKAIAGRARKYKLSTDASHRFERGVDYETTASDVDYISALIVQICGGNCGQLDDQTLALPERKAVTMRVARASKIIGLPIDAARCMSLLQGLGLQCTLSADKAQITVVPPSYRFDMEIEEDLIEEVARLYGFENLPLRAPLAPAQMMPNLEAKLTLSAIKRRVADRDYQEVVNFSFAPSSMEKAIRPDVEPIKLLNPIAENLDVMRTSLWASLLGTLQYNLNRKASRVRLFEVGRVFEKSPSQEAGPLEVKGVYQPIKLAMLAYGSADDEQWGSPARAADFFDIKADVEALFGADQIVQAKAASHPALHPGRSAALSLASAPDVSIGWIGELHPRLQQELGLPSAPLLVELSIDALQAKRVASYVEVSKFPPVTRDIAILVPEALSAQAALEAIAAECRENAQLKALQNVKLFDEYRGKLLETKEKSLAFRLVLQDTEATLSDAQSDAVVAAVVARLAKDCGGKLRT